MKTLTTTLAFATLLATAPLYAVDAHHPEQAAGQATAPAATGEEAKATLQKLQDNTAKMRTQLEGIAKATTDDERRRLMAEHIQTMQEGMDMARGMQSGMTMGCPMMEGGQKGGMMGGGSSEGMHQMEKRMDMMQMMLEQMMRRLDEKAASKPTQ